MTELDDVESVPYSGNWRLVKTLDGFALDRKIRALGWNFFFMAGAVRAMFFGARGEKKLYRALSRILGKLEARHFNSLEITGIAPKHFLGVPYFVVSAHSRHIQQRCYLDDAAARQSSEHDAEWARG